MMSSEVDPTIGHHHHHHQHLSHHHHEDLHHHHHQHQHQPNHHLDTSVQLAHDSTTCYYFVCRLCALKCGQQLPGPPSAAITATSALAATATADANPLSLTGGGVPIFSDEGAQRQVRKKIFDCLQFTVHDGDKFPRTVCRDCLRRLDESHDFLIKCLESQQFLADLATHEVFDAIYEQKSSIIGVDGDQGDGCDVAGSDELPDTSTIAADLDQLVDEADISQMMRYHDEHIGAVELHSITGHLSAAAVAAAASTTPPPPLLLPVVADRQHQLHQPLMMMVAEAEESGAGDVDSLPDITLYSFDGISAGEEDDADDGAGGKVDATEDAFDLDEAAASFAAVDNVDYVQQQHHASGLYEDAEAAAALGQCIDMDMGVFVMPETEPDPEQLEQPEKTATAAMAIATAPTVVSSSCSSSSKCCPICAKSFATNYKLRVHERTHSLDQPFSCSQPGCGKAFRSKPGLVQHEAQHTGRHQFACAVCGKGFQVRSYLTSHMRCHSEAKPWRCGECGESFRAKQTLLDHEARHLGVKAFACPRACGQSFISKALAARHERLVHAGGGGGGGAGGGTPEFGGVEAEQAQQPPVKRFGCELCPKQFARQAYLKTHMLSHTGERPFACDLCDRRMSTANDLKLHRRTHTSEAAYVCETCGKAFKRSDSLAIHKRSHTGERPYACSHCGQRFTQVTAMKLHERLHTGDRPYSCPVCPRWFVSGSILTAHLKKHSDRTVVEQEPQEQQQRQPEDDREMITT